METTPREIALLFVERLSEVEPPYRLATMRKVGVPDYLVTFVKSRLIKKLHQTITYPSTPWADTKAVAVRQAWEQLKEALEAELIIPSDKAEPLLEDAIETLLPILREPLTQIPAYLFADTDQLDQEALRVRLRPITIYRQYSEFLIRYMERKNIQQISRTKCEQVLRIFDRRVTDSYEAAQWLEVLEPWFDLMGERLDPEPLYQFFAEKERMDLAERFKQMPRAVNRQELLMMLGADELPEEFFKVVDADEETPEESDEASDSGEQSDEVVEEIEEPVEEPEPKKQEEEETENIQQEETEPAGEEEIEETEDTGTNEEEDYSLNRFFGDEDQPEEEPEEVEEEPDDSFNSQFAPVEQEEEEPEPSTPIDEPEAEEEGEESEEQPSEDEEEPEEETKKPPLIREPGQMEAGWARRRTSFRGDTLNQSMASDEDEEEPSIEAEEESGEDVPMWKRFLTPEERAELERREQEEPEEEEEEEPVIDLTSEEETEERFDDLLDHLSDEKDRFVEEVFKGSEKAYNEALENIAGMDDWKEVSHYLHKEVFQRNMVDMYSEIAIDFTDRLQDYFMNL